VPPKPTLLAADNFTPPSRTPWGGTRLLHEFKRDLGIGVSADTAVGESWELSLGPEFPSRTADGDALAAVISAEPVAWLGAEAPASGLLVKWLDAGDDLSLQIHPEDDYAGLAQGDAGKVEAWYVVAHEPGAGLYLGFRPRVGADEVRRTLAADGDLRELMRFETVARGDFVLLAPGTPHAVGRGVTLIEPQYVAPGRRGVTYRYWDFRRRYDATGRPDPRGKPRELHLEHALAVTRFASAGAGADPTAAIRARCGWPDSDAAARCEVLCGPDAGAPLHSLRLNAARLLGSGRTELPGWNVLRALTVVHGVATLGRGSDALRVEAGRTVAIPATSGALRVELEAAHALLSAVRVAPASATPQQAH